MIDREPEGLPAAGRLGVTRIANACVLFELGDAAVLTDPWFTRHWMFVEQPALAVADVPRLAAIVGSHSVMDHWNIDAMAAYPHRSETPVLVATRSMVRKARAAGFPRVEEVAWGATRELAGGLVVEVLPAQRVTGLKVNNYVFTTRAGLRVFFGGETRELEPLRRYRRDHPAVDVFVGPVNGMRLLGHKLVTDAREAVEAARILGATTMIPIHDGHRSLAPLVWPTSTARDAVRAAGDLQVRCLAAGRRWLL